MIKVYKDTSSPLPIPTIKLCSKHEQNPPSEYTTEIKFCTDCVCMFLSSEIFDEIKESKETLEEYFKRRESARI